MSHQSAGLWNKFMTFLQTLTTEPSKLEVNAFESLHIYDREAIVHQPIYPCQQGRVYFQGTWWPARCQHPVTLLPEQTVHVVGITNITLLVEPITSQPRFGEFEREKEAVGGSAGSRF